MNYWSDFGGQKGSPLASIRCEDDLNRGVAIFSNDGNEDGASVVEVDLGFGGVFIDGVSLELGETILIKGTHSDFPSNPAGVVEALRRINRLLQIHIPEGS